MMRERERKRDRERVCMHQGVSQMISSVIGDLQPTMRPVPEYTAAGGEGERWLRQMVMELGEGSV